MLSLTRRLLTSRKPLSRFSTLLIPTPNSPSSDLGPLLSASSYLPSPVDILQICSSKNSENVISEIQNITPSSVVNSIFLNDIKGMEDYCHFHCLDEIKKFVYENKNKYTHVVMGNGNLSKEILPRLSSANDSQCISDIISILDHERFQRPIYAGNAVSTVKVNRQSSSGKNETCIKIFIKKNF